MSNPYHIKSGPHGGEFTSGPDSAKAKETQKRHASQWKKNYAGSYVSKKSGFTIERSEDFPGRWNVINPETRKVLDHMPSLKAAKRIYE